METASGGSTVGPDIFVRRERPHARRRPGARQGGRHPPTCLVDASATWVSVTVRPACTPLQPA
eukprot:scaffold966_cov415-Prasinococcus_capsulatus_cf.AAC.27